MKIVKLKRKPVVKPTEEEIRDDFFFARDIAWDESSKEAKERFAQSLRDNPTESEQIFFDMLTEMKVRFEFQPVMYGFIPDFYFPNHGRKIIEIDGSSHNTKQRYDEYRDGIFRSKGHKMWHIRTDRVYLELEILKWEVKSFLSGGTCGYKSQKKQARKIVKARKRAALPKL